MKRTILSASIILVALAACDDRSEVERERTAPVERAEAPRSPLGEPLGEPAGEPIDTPRTGGVDRDDLDQQPVAGRAGSDAERATSGGATGALSHVPPDCKALIHAKASDLGGLPGAKEHLFPAIDEARKRNQNVQQIVGLLKDGGVDSAKDVDEMAVCVKDAPTPKEAHQGERAVLENTSVVVAVTGDFAKGELVPALLKRGGEAAEEVEIEGVDVFHDSNRNLFVGQARDGTIIAAGSRDSFSKALSGDGDYDLSADQAFGLLLPEGTMQSLLQRFADPAANKLAGEVERAVFTFDASQKRLALRIDMPDHTQAAELGGVFKATLEQWKSEAPKDATERRFADVLKEAKVEYEDDVVVLNVAVKDEQIETVMKKLAEQVAAIR